MKVKNCMYAHVIGMKQDEGYVIVDGFYTSMSPEKTAAYAREVYGDGYTEINVQLYRCDKVEVLVK